MSTLSSEINAQKQAYEYYMNAFSSYDLVDIESERALLRLSHVVVVSDTIFLSREYAVEILLIKRFIRNKRTEASI